MTFSFVLMRQVNIGYNARSHQGVFTRYMGRRYGGNIEQMNIEQMNKEHMNDEIRFGGDY